MSREMDRTIALNAARMLVEGAMQSDEESYKHGCYEQIIVLIDMLLGKAPDLPQMPPLPNWATENEEIMDMLKDLGVERPTDIC